MKFWQYSEKLVEELRAFFFARDRDIQLQAGRKLVLGNGTELTNDHGNLDGLSDDDHTQYVLRSILTTKGDIFVRNSSAVARLGVGSNDQILIADSAETTGIKWDDLSSIATIGHIIQEEGGNLAQETYLNFRGAYVTASDDSGNSATTIDILEDTETENTVLAGPATAPAAKPAFRPLVEDDLPDGAFVPIGGIILWRGAIVNIPTNWALCDGLNGTPDLTDMFVIGAGDTYSPDDTGGAATIDIQHSHTSGTLATDSDGHTHGPGTLDTDNDSHSHDVTGSTASDGGHTHGAGTLSATGSGGGVSVASGAAFTVNTEFHTHSISGSTASDSHSHGDGTLATDSDSHDHAVNAGVTASDSHSHSVNSGSTANALSTTQSILPSYYALAYIMRTA